MNIHPAYERDVNTHLPTLLLPIIQIALLHSRLELHVWVHGLRVLLTMFKTNGRYMRVRLSLNELLVNHFYIFIEI